MKISQIQGNESIKRAFSGMVASGRIPHAVMLHEDDGCGAVGIALALVQYLFCRNHDGTDSCGSCPSCNRVSKMIHPDVHFIFPMTSGRSCADSAPQFRELALSNPRFTEADLNDAVGIDGKSSIISVAEAKSMLDMLSLSALEGGYRAVIIYLPEKMNQEAANRLLKIIEEPPQMTQFVLITHSPEKVLTTISSRCQRFRVDPAAAVADDGLFPEFAALLEALLSHNLEAVLDVTESLAALPSREKAREFCRYAAARLRDIFLVQQGIMPAEGDTGGWARSCRKTFPRTALSVLDRTASLVERNVNLKILFTDMGDRLFHII